jgi:hypothetical protein
LFVVNVATVPLNDWPSAVLWLGTEIDVIIAWAGAVAPSHDAQTKIVNPISLALRALKATRKPPINPPGPRRDGT